MAIRKAPRDDEQLELFTAMLSDIAMRDARETMDVPFLSLSKKPRFEPIDFQKGEARIVVTGGKPYGIANIWDWDLMLWLLSQVRQQLDNGKTASRKIRFHRRDFLKAARQSAGGAQYRRLEQSIERLANTNVFTTIRPRPGKRTVKFTWIEAFDMERDEQGRLVHAVVTIPEWLFEAVCDKSRVLTLDRDFFLLTGGLEKWLYRIIRKSAGQTSWKWSLRALHERSGSRAEFKYFARDVKKLARQGVLLGYRIGIEEDGAEAHLVASKLQPSTQRRASTPPVPRADRASEEGKLRIRRTETYERARELLPREDVYELAKQWRQTTVDNALAVRDADRCFLGWCRARARAGAE